MHCCAQLASLQITMLPSFSRYPALRCMLSSCLLFFHKAAPMWVQAWALMEQEQGNMQDARRLFKLASRADPSHLYVWQVCMCVGSEGGQPGRADELWRRACQICPL
jgi:hypothetical protein